MFFTHDRTQEWYYPMWGASHAEPLIMQAGEKLNIEVEVKWAPEDLLPHDFSVVVQAEKSPVTMTIKHDHQSEQFPNFKLSENVKLIGLDGSQSIPEDNLDLPKRVMSSSDASLTYDF